LSSKILAVAAKRPYLPSGTEHISLRQADNLMDAAQLARETDFPLYCHATIHWGQTAAGDDKDGKRFTLVRNGFKKYLERKKIPWLAVWVREAPKGVCHSHMVFYLPSKWLEGEPLAEIEQGLARLVARHGNGIERDFPVRLKRRNGWPSYFLKGGTREVRSKYGVKRKWPRQQGVIINKRSGVSQNTLGPKVRERWWGNTPQRLRA